MYVCSEKNRLLSRCTQCLGCIVSLAIIFSSTLLSHSTSLRELLPTWQLLQDTGYTSWRGLFLKQSFVTWQILGLALHSDRPGGGVWTLFYIYTQLKRIVCDFADFSRTGVWDGRYRGWGMELDTHSLGWGTGHSSASWGGNFQQLQSDCFAHLRDSHLLTDCLKFLLQQTSFLKKKYGRGFQI